METIKPDFELAWHEEMPEPEYYTFDEHVALLVKEHGVPVGKAKMMAWMEGPREKVNS